MNNLKYARQFLLSSAKCEKLEEWQHSKIGIYNIYVHPYTMLVKKNNDENNAEIALIGHIINPHNPNESSSDILDSILNNISIASICEKLYYHGGRFVLVIKLANEYFIFHDACGLKMVFYTQFKSEVYAASQPLLLKEVIPLQQGEKYAQYQQSKHKKSDIEYWIPSGCSLYEDVYQLTPNHYLKFSDLEQKRYWPNRKPQKMQLNDAANKAASLLKNIMIAFDQRFKLALPLTAGWDSRTILSASKDIADNLYFYTLKYRDLTSDSNDIKIPGKILAHLGYTHNVIDCGKELDEDFYEIYKNNSDMSHLDWGKIAYGMLDNYPSDRAFIKGSCAEIARGGYYESWTQTKISSIEEVLNLQPDWKDIDFIKEQILKWYSEISLKEVNLGYDIDILFYWEHRIGSWQAQNQLEWDVVQETITPFNTRELFDILLSVEYKYRRRPKYKLFRKIIENSWKETLVEPINPKRIGFKRIINFIVSKFFKK